MARLIALALAMVALVACTDSPGPSATPTVTASPSASASAVASVEPSETATSADDPLVVLSTRGGECPAGTCGSTIVVERSGRVHQTEPEPMERGTARPDIMEALELAIDTADFAAIRSVPFSGECPVNFDGQEQIFEFSTDDGVERLASCETELDPEHPMFAALQALLENLPAG